jgi:hypothetical protein
VYKKAFAIFLRHLGNPITPEDFGLKFLPQKLHTSYSKNGLKIKNSRYEGGGLKKK